jgi:hypothetical protein
LFFARDDAAITCSGDFPQRQLDARGVELRLARNLMAFVQQNNRPGSQLLPDRGGDANRITPDGVECANAPPDQQKPAASQDRMHERIRQAGW